MGGLWGVVGSTGILFILGCLFYIHDTTNSVEPPKEFLSSMCFDGLMCVVFYGILIPFAGIAGMLLSSGKPGADN